MELGGQGKPSEIYPLVTKKSPEIRDEDLSETVPSGGNRWTNRIQWVRQKLIEKGEMGSTIREIWTITYRGRKRVETKEPSVPTVNFVELYEDYEESFRSQLLYKLDELTPRQFELFSRKLLQAYEFVVVKVTGISSEGAFKT